MPEGRRMRVCTGKGEIRCREEKLGSCPQFPFVPSLLKRVTGGGVDGFPELI
jgi:hypothetical protein